MGQCFIHNIELLDHSSNELTVTEIFDNNIDNFPLNIIEPNNILPNIEQNIINNNNYQYSNYIRPKECIANCNDINDFYSKILEKRTTSTRTKKMLLQYKPIIEKLEIEQKKLLEDRKNFTKIELKYQKIRSEHFNLRRILKNQYLITNRLLIKKNKLYHRVTTAVNIENMKLYNIDCEAEKNIDNININNIYNRSYIDMDRLHNRFPDEILDIIGSYLTYNVKILMIENFHNPLSYLDRLGAKPIRSLVDYISDNIHFTGISPFFYISQVCQYDMLSIMNTRDEGIVIIKTLINIFKKKRPKIALNLLKMFAILNKAGLDYESGLGKKYYQYIDFKFIVT
jgi:hypothetical protein